MKPNQKAIWQTTAELFAMSILDICPKIVFQSVRAGTLGFVCEFVAPDPVHKDQIDVAVSLVKEALKKGVKVEILEMVSKNVVDYMKYLKQPLLAKSVNREEQFTKVVKIDDRYANPLVGDVELDLSQIRVIEVGETEEIGEVKFHKKMTPLYRISGFAFTSNQELKEHKKRVSKGAEIDHRNVPVEGEVIDLWRSVYRMMAQVLSKEGFIEKWRNSELEDNQFAEYDELIEGQEDFGMKANGRFRGIKFSLPDDPEKLIKKLEDRLPIESNRDVYHITWPVIEAGEEGRVWIDRIVALLIEEKNVSKKPFFSKVVTK